MADTPRRKVLVLYTGGTIGMVPMDAADPLSPLAPAPKERLLPFVANPLDAIAWDLHGLEDAGGKSVEPLDSSDVGPVHWGWMARAVERAYDAYDGFVILHGTDTMAYTASALAFMLEGLGKPVVLTGSQAPIHQPGSDAVGNFADALWVAAEPALREVVICFGGLVLRGCRATKVSTHAAIGFASPNAPPLGTVGEGLSTPGPPPQGTTLRVSGELAEDVLAIQVHPGMKADLLRHLLSADGLRGVVLRGFGAGNLPIRAGLAAVLAEATARGLVIVNTSQCLEGGVEMGRYQASAGLAAAGVLSGGDMTFEAALAKLMWLLGHGGAAAARVGMGTDLRGELTSGI